MNFFYANGTPIINSLKVTSEVPLDPRLTVENIAERDSLVTNHISYDRMKVYVKSNDTKYIYHKDTGEWEIDNKFSEEDKSKLDRISNYLIDTEYLYNPKNELLFREYSYDTNTSITTLRDHILQEAKVTENGELYNGLLSKFYVNRLNNIRGYINSINITPSSENENLYLVRNYYNPDSNTNDTQNINIPIVTDYNNGLIDPATKHWIDNAKGLSIWGTTSETWQLGKDNIDERLDPNGGVIIKNSGGIAEIRNNTDTSYADLTLNNIIIKGDVTQEGKTFITEAETVEVKDNTLLLNRGEVGSGVTKGVAGIEIDRGTEPKYQILFDESDDRFKVGKEGDLWCVTLRDDDADMVDGMFTSWDASTKRLKTTNLVTESTPLLFGNSNYKQGSQEHIYDDSFTKYSFKNSDGSGSMWHVSGEYSWNVDTNKNSFRFWKPVLGTTFKRASDNSEVLYHADIINDVITGGSDKVLSAEQGKLLSKWVKPISLIKVVNDVALWQDSISYTMPLSASDFEILDQDELVYRFKNNIPFTIDMLYAANGITFKMHRDITFDQTADQTAIAFRCFVSQGKSCFDVQYWINFSNTTGLPLSGTKRVVKMADNSYSGQTPDSDPIVNKLKNITLYTEEYGTEGQVLLYKNNKPIWSDKLEITKDYLPLSGGIMTGSIRFPVGLGIVCEDVSGSAAYAVLRTWNANNATRMYVGTVNFPTYISSTASDLIHDRHGSSYLLWDSFNLPNPVRYVLDANGYPTLLNEKGSKFIYIKAGTNGLLPNSQVTLANGGIGLLGTKDWAFNAGYINNLHLNRITFGEAGPYIIGDTAAIQFLTPEGAAKKIATGSLYVGASYAMDALALVPTNGVYSSGAIKSASGFTNNFRQTNLNLAKTGNDVLYISSFTEGATGSPGSDSASNRIINDGMFLTYFWQGDFAFQLAADIDGSGIAYRHYQPSTGSSNTGWRFLADTTWVVSTINNGNFLKKTGDTATGQIILDSHGLAFQNIAWSKDLAPNRTYGGYLQVLDAYNAGTAAAGGPSNYGTVLQVNSRNSHWANQLWFGQNQEIYFRHMAYNSTSYGSWKRLATDVDLVKYLPLSGGTISSSSSTPLLINSTSGTQSAIGFSRNGTGKGLVGFNDVLGGAFLEGDVGKLLIIKSDGAYYGTTSSNTKLATVTDLSGYLPLTGGTLTGQLTILQSGDIKLRLQSNDDDNYSTIQALNKSGSQVGIFGFAGNKWAVGHGGTYYEIWDKYNLTKPVNLNNGTTGSATTIYNRDIGVNGTNWTFLSSINSSSSTSIYAPTSAGTSGQILQSTGGVPTWVNASSITGNYVSKSGDTMTGKLINRAGINLNNAGKEGISFYSTSYVTWFEYMSSAATGKGSACTNGTASTFGNVTTWARRSTIEQTSGYGWIWDSCSNTADANPTPRMALSSNNGNLYVQGTITSNGKTVATVDQIPSVSGYATQSWVNTQLGSYVAKSGSTMTGALTMSNRRNNTVIDVIGGAGNSWDEGAGALSVQVPSDSGQTPLILARRSGAAIDTKVATERLLSMEILDTGTSFIIGMSGAEALQLDLTSSTNKTGTGKLFGKTIATTDQIPSLSGYATQNWCNGQFPTKTGTGASGTWGISISGTAATATTWNGYKIWTGTEDELPSSRDANTLYFVKKSS